MVALKEINKFEINQNSEVFSKTFGKLIQNCSQISEKVQCKFVKCSDVNYSEFFFKCLLFRIKTSPKGLLVEGVLLNNCNLKCSSKQLSKVLKLPNLKLFWLITLSNEFVYQVFSIEFRILDKIKGMGAR